MVSKFTQPDMTSMSPTVLKAAIDAAIAVLAELGAGFAPRASDVPDMIIHVDAGATFNRALGARTPVGAQATGAQTVPGAGTSKWVRVYVDELGVVGTVDGAAAVSPVVPYYPAGTMPICRVQIFDTTTVITNDMIVDERCWNLGYGTPRNTNLVTSSQVLPCPDGVKFRRVTACGPGGPGGPGATNSAGTSHAGGGAGGSGGSVNNRLFAPEDLNIVIGAGSPGGIAALVNGSNGTVGSVSGTTTVTGVSSGNVISCGPGGPGAIATAATPAAGAGGAAASAPTNGVAGTVGQAGQNTGANASGGKGPGPGIGAAMSLPAPGGTINPSSRNGQNGERGTGGGGGVGTGGNGGKGGDGWVLVEDF